MRKLKRTISMLVIVMLVFMILAPAALAWSHASGCVVHEYVEQSIKEIVYLD